MSAILAELRAKWDISDDGINADNPIWTASQIMQAFNVARDTITRAIDKALIEEGCTIKPYSAPEYVKINNGGQYMREVARFPYWQIEMLAPYLHLSANKNSRRNGKCITRKKM